MFEKIWNCFIYLINMLWNRKRRSRSIEQWPTIWIISTIKQFKWWKSPTKSRYNKLNLFHFMIRITNTLKQNVEFSGILDWRYDFIIVLFTFISRIFWILMVMHCFTQSKVQEAQVQVIVNHHKIPAIKWAQVAVALVVIIKEARINIHNISNKVCGWTFFSINLFAFLKTLN